METIFEFDEEDEYSLPDFFKHFKDKLPMLVIVTGGDYGLTRWDDLCNDTVLRYHRHYGLKRVVAKPSNEFMMHRREYLSIPVLAPYRYTIASRKQTDEKELTMEEILATHKLPVLVQFSRKKIPEVFKEHAGTSILIQKVYEEYYLQGNAFIDDEMQTPQMTNFLSPSIFVSPILGLKDRRKEDFEKYKQDLDEYVEKNVTFSPQDCNLEVKKFRYGDKGFEGVVDIDEVLPFMDKGETEAPKLPPRRGASVDTQNQSDEYYAMPSIESTDDEEEEDNGNYEEVKDDFIAKKLPPKPIQRKLSQEPPDLPPRPHGDEREQSRIGMKSNTKTVGGKVDYANDVLCQVLPFQPENANLKGGSKKEDDKGVSEPAKDTPHKDMTSAYESDRSSESASSEYLSIKEIGEHNADSPSKLTRGYPTITGCSKQSKTPNAKAQSRQAQKGTRNVNAQHRNIKHKGLHINQRDQWATGAD
ncbi:hypothetical protein FSP39_004553 [Pinctada imbricata]|uniref:Uncharacterized protein n=1 Tax=Pinctada imbricata TaxID=66713 RepID=A0AA88XRM1_PINIB|nr:hypothetical protein FSP39_004553 [Pinctada imbricata]